jgi:hypothetical protein
MEVEVIAASESSLLNRGPAQPYFRAVDTRAKAAVSAFRIRALGELALPNDGSSRLTSIEEDEAC